MNEQAKYAKGPWTQSRLEPRRVIHDGGYYRDADTLVMQAVAIVQEYESCEMTMANARLIAAAPDLLDVCNRILADDDQVELLSDETCAALRAVITKAIGTVPSDDDAGDVLAVAERDDRFGVDAQHG
jgi:hypothetical protein